MDTNVVRHQLLVLLCLSHKIRPGRGARSLAVGVSPRKESGARLGAAERRRKLCGGVPSPLRGFTYVFMAFSAGWRPRLNSLGRSAAILAHFQEGKTTFNAVAK
jgi:hypothetical protein